MIYLIVFLTVFFVYLTARLHAGQTWQEPETDPCETCLRWGECHGVDVDFCPRCTEWRVL